MSDFLASMAAGSRARVDAARTRESLAELIARAEALPPPPRLLLGGFDLIAEVKRRAPSVGALAPQATREVVVARARAYAKAGAAAVSVLTEPHRFDGDPDDLRAVAAAVPVPVMRKDFVVDPYQVWEARAWGAGGVLLIVRMVSDDALEAQLEAADAAGLFVLLEAFDGDDLARAARAAARGSGRSPLLVGVNTRDLSTLDVDAGRLARLAPHLPPVPCVAESGLATPDDAARVAGLGYRLALVGSALMRASDPEVLAAGMLAAGRAP